MIIIKILRLSLWASKVNTNGRRIYFKWIEWHWYKTSLKSCFSFLADAGGASADVPGGGDVTADDSSERNPQPADANDDDGDENEVKKKQRKKKQRNKPGEKAVDKIKGLRQTDPPTIPIAELYPSGNQIAWIYSHWHL